MLLHGGVKASSRRGWVLVAIGAVGGLLSGAFGVGGGIVMVPLLVAFGGLDQRRAAATSLLAIVPTAVVGTVTYTVEGQIDVAAAALLALGAVCGSLLGTWLLRRISVVALRWLFIALVIAVAIRLALAVPERAEHVDLTLGVVIGYVLIGLVMGVCSGLFGIGGGAVAVPALVAILGVSDLVAKGTSLLAMIPTASAGSIANARGKLLDPRAGLLVGVAASIAAVPGSLLALLMSPRVSAVLFAVFLLGVATQMTWRGLRQRRDEP
jgi:uncharacterized protein